jgi:MraZ protein
MWDNNPTKWGKVGFGGVKPRKRTDVLLPSGESERMFVGTFEHTIDDKGRLTLPAKWRTELAGGVFITRGADKCLYILPKAKFEAIASEIDGQGLERADARAWSRHIAGMATDADPDKQGRVIIPTNLREFAGLDGDVVVVGVLSRIEVWDPKQHHAAEDKVILDVENVAERIGAMMRGADKKG